MKKAIGILEIIGGTAMLACGILRVIRAALERE